VRKTIDNGGMNIKIKVTKQKESRESGVVRYGDKRSEAQIEGRK
jgi:hypothetical protein